MFSSRCIFSPRRRRFLAAAGPAFAVLRVAAAGRPQNGLEQFGAATPACKPKTATPSVPVDATYRAGSPRRTSFITPGIAGTRLALTGTVSGLSCGPIKDAVVDFWQADSKGVYAATGAGFRGFQLTGAEGQFRLETIVPGAAGAGAPCINVNVRVPGKANFWTRLFFAGDPKNAHDPSYRPELAMKLTSVAGAETATFDIVLEL